MPAFFLTRTEGRSVSRIFSFRPRWRRSHSGYKHRRQIPDQQPTVNFTTYAWRKGERHRFPTIGLIRKQDISGHQENDSLLMSATAWRKATTETFYATGNNPIGNTNCAPSRMRCFSPSRPNIGSHRMGRELIRIFPATLLPVVNAGRNPRNNAAAKILGTQFAWCRTTHGSDGGQHSRDKPAPSSPCRRRRWPGARLYGCWRSGQNRPPLLAPGKNAAANKRGFSPALTPVPSVTWLI